MNEVVLTLDVDWAPDFVIDDVAELLRERKVRATWFATHRSPAVERLVQDDRFEVGVHPNFLPGSDHGDHASAVLENVTRLFPEAVSFRSHGLVQSGPLLRRVMEETDLQVDCSTFLPDMEGLRPCRVWIGGDSLVRVPFVWADSHELDRTRSDWTVEGLLERQGLRVLLFHPLHVHLNLSDRTVYRELADRPGGAAQLTREETAPRRREGPGPRTCLERAAAFLAEKGGGRTVCQVADTWAAAESV